MSLLDLIPAPYRLAAECAIVAALALAVTFAIHHYGAQRFDAGKAEVTAQYAKQAREADAKREAITAPIAQKQEAAQVQIRTVTQTIIKKVPVYVKSTDCPMPGGFRVLHDAAANGEVPDPARIPDAAPAAAQDVAETIAANYGTYREVAERLIGLQEWVRAQAEASK